MKQKVAGKFWESGLVNFSKIRAYHISRGKKENVKTTKSFITFPLDEFILKSKMKKPRGIGKRVMITFTQTVNFAAFQRRPLTTS